MTLITIYDPDEPTAPFTGEQFDDDAVEVFRAKDGVGNRLYLLHRWRFVLGGVSDERTGSAPAYAVVGLRFAKRWLAANGHKHILSEIRKAEKPSETSWTA